MGDDQVYTISTGTTAEPTDLHLLIEAYVVLNKIHAEPGDKSHMLANSIRFLEREIRKVLSNED